MKEKFTITVLTENHPGLLSRVANIFTRRKLNIESLTVTRSDYEGLHRFNIFLYTTEKLASDVVKQIEKQVEVVKAAVHKEDEILSQELALFKVPTNALMESNKIERLVRQHNARMLEMNVDYTYFEKFGNETEINSFMENLKEVCEVQLVRSGRVAISKSDYSVENYNKIPKMESYSDPE